MPRFPSTKCRRVLAALTRIGWIVTRQAGSHRTLERDGESVTLACHEGDELGPRILSKIAKQTGLKPSDL